MESVTLMGAVEVVQEEARQCRAMCLERGVFFLYSTDSGDAWLLEMTDGDCIQLAREGVALTPEIIENSDTIEINYSHTFMLRGKALVSTAYENKEASILPDAPTAVLSAAMRRLRKKITKEQLANIHLPCPLPANNA
jgi:hypothetical protein